MATNITKLTFDLTAGKNPFSIEDNKFGPMDAENVRGDRKRFY